MTDLIRIKETVHDITAVKQYLTSYAPDWSNSTMSTVNELTSQFYGWLPSVPSIPSTQGDPVTWVLLGIIGIILIYKL